MGYSPPDQVRIGYPLPWPGWGIPPPHIETGYAWTGHAVGSMPLGLSFLTRKSCGKLQEAYHPWHNLFKHILSWGGTYLSRGGTYLGWGVGYLPWLGSGVPTLAGGYLPWPGGCLPCLGWGTYLGRRVHILARMGYPPLLTDRHL